MGLRKSLVFAATFMSFVGCAKSIRQPAGFVDQTNEISVSSVTPEQLISIGYDTNVSKRIASYRADIAYLIANPNVKLNETSLPKTVSYKSINAPRASATLQQAQREGRNPVTVFRGIGIAQSEYDPKYLKPGGQYTDIEYVTNSSDYALSYAQRGDYASAAFRAVPKHGIVLRYEIPEFLLFQLTQGTVKGGGDEEVFLRDQITDESIFLTGIETVSEGQVDPGGFKSVSYTLQEFPKVHLTSEHSFNADGSYAININYVRKVCALTKIKDQTSNELLIFQVPITYSKEIASEVNGSIQTLGKQSPNADIVLSDFTNATLNAEPNLEKSWTKDAINSSVEAITSCLSSISSLNKNF
jgi:hypothetical protein